MALSAQVRGWSAARPAEVLPRARGHCGALGPAPAALTAALVAAELCVWLAAATADGRKAEPPQRAHGEDVAMGSGSR